MSSAISDSVSMKTPKPSESTLSSAELGMMITLASFGMLFGTLFLSYLLARARFPVWPPIGVEAIPKLLPTLSTVILLISSFFIHRAVGAFKMELKKEFLKFWNAGLAFGALFLASQAWLWAQVLGLGIKADEHLFGSIFYTMIGLHALHIVAGLVVLVVARIKVQKALRVSQAQAKPLDSQVPKLAAWFWHFLDAMWILMYVLLVWI